MCSTFCLWFYEHTGIQQHIDHHRERMFDYHVWPKRNNALIKNIYIQCQLLWNNNNLKLLLYNVIYKYELIKHLRIQETQSFISVVKGHGFLLGLTATSDCGQKWLSETEQIRIECAKRKMSGFDQTTTTIEMIKELFNWTF